MYSFQSLVEKQKNIAKQFSWSPEALQFQQKLKDKKLSNEKAAEFLKELVYFVNRYFEFGSAILHRNLRSEVMFPLSYDFFRVSKLNLQLDSESHLPLPSTESICNHLLVTSETDPTCYYLSYLAIFETIIPSQLKETVSSYKVDAKITAELHDCFQILHNTPSVIAEISSHLGQTSSKDQNRIIGQIYSLYELMDYWYKELEEDYFLKLAL